MIVDFQYCTRCLEDTLHYCYLPDETEPIEIHECSRCGRQEEVWLDEPEDDFCQECQHDPCYCDDYRYQRSIEERWEEEDRVDPYDVGF